MAIVLAATVKPPAKQQLTLPLGQQGQVATLDKQKRKTKGSAGGLAVGCEALKHNRKIEKVKSKKERKAAADRPWVGKGLRLRKRKV